MFDHGDAGVVHLSVTLKLEVSGSILISSNYVREYLHSGIVVFCSPRSIAALAFSEALRYLSSNTSVTHQSRDISTSDHNQHAADL